MRNRNDCRFLCGDSIQGEAIFRVFLESSVSIFKLRSIPHAGVHTSWVQVIKASVNFCMVSLVCA